MKTSAVATRTPPQGGKLNSGNPGNKGGTGRPPSELRARLQGVFADRVKVIEQIADGTPIKRVEVSLLALLEHANCPKCGEALKLNENVSPVEALTITVAALESASPKDRLSALDLAGKYGLGTKEEITLVSPEVREKMLRLVALIRSRDQWESTELLALGGEIFT